MAFILSLIYTSCNVFLLPSVSSMSNQRKWNKLFEKKTHFTVIPHQYPLCIINKSITNFIGFIQPILVLFHCRNTTQYSDFGLSNETDGDYSPAIRSSFMHFTLRPMHRWTSESPPSVNTCAAVSILIGLGHTGEDEGRLGYDHVNLFVRLSVPLPRPTQTTFSSWNALNISSINLYDVVEAFL